MNDSILSNYRIVGIWPVFTVAFNQHAPRSWNLGRLVCDKFTHIVLDDKGPGSIKTKLSLQFGNNEAVKVMRSDKLSLKGWIQQYWDAGNNSSSSEYR